MKTFFSLSDYLDEFGEEFTDEEKNIMASALMLNNHAKALEEANKRIKELEKRLNLTEKDLYTSICDQLDELEKKLEFVMSKGAIAKGGLVVDGKQIHETEDSVGWLYDVINKNA